MGRRIRPTITGLVSTVVACCTSEARGCSCSDWRECAHGREKCEADLVFHLRAMRPTGYADVVFPITCDGDNSGGCGFSTGNLDLSSHVDAAAVKPTVTFSDIRMMLDRGDRVGAEKLLLQLFGPEGVEGRRTSCCDVGDHYEDDWVSLLHCDEDYMYHNCECFPFFCRGVWLTMESPTRIRTCILDLEYCGICDCGQTQRRLVQLVLCCVNPWAQLPGWIKAQVLQFFPNKKPDPSLHSCLSTEQFWRANYLDKQRRFFLYLDYDGYPMDVFSRAIPKKGCADS
ncbi:hypothetical protein Pelo_13670 [Pelomyxa schiedti]|nr:hypothetical protein Pelo_13670 [Pelomyxa schiedti]